jgi:hypothetical protein
VRRRGHDGSVGDLSRRRARGARARIAEYARVPFADVGPIKIDNDLADEQVLFLSDHLPDRLYRLHMARNK